MIRRDRLQIQLTQCHIRSFIETDAAAIQRHANNLKIWLNVRDFFPHPYRIEHAEAFLKTVVQQKPETIVAISNGDEAIGAIGLRLGEDVHRKTAELGYWLAEGYWGRGITTEAVRAFARYAFETFDLVRIYAQPFSENGASARVLEKSGFTLEGRLQANVFKEGRVLDSLMYAIVR